MTNNNSNKKKIYLLLFLELVAVICGVYVYQLTRNKEWGALQKLKSSEVHERVEAANYLVSIQSKKAAEYWRNQINKFIDQSRSDTRWGKYKHLRWELSQLIKISPTGIDSFIEYLKSPNESLRSLAVSCLFENREQAKKIEPTLSRALLDPVTIAGDLDHIEDCCYLLATINRDSPRKIKALIEYVGGIDDEDKKSFLLNRILNEISKVKKPHLKSAQFIFKKFAEGDGKLNYGDFGPKWDSKSEYPESLSPLIVDTLRIISGGKVSYLDSYFYFLRDKLSGYLHLYDLEFIEAFKLCSEETKFTLATFYGYLGLKSKKEVRSFLLSCEYKLIDKDIIEDIFDSHYTLNVPIGVGIVEILLSHRDERVRTLICEHLDDSYRYRELAEGLIRKAQIENSQYSYSDYLMKYVNNKNSPNPFYGLSFQEINAKLEAALKVYKNESVVHIDVYKVIDWLYRFGSYGKSDYLLKKINKSQIIKSEDFKSSLDTLVRWFRWQVHYFDYDSLIQLNDFKHELLVRAAKDQYIKNQLNQLKVSELKKSRESFLRLKILLLPQADTHEELKVLSQDKSSKNVELRNLSLIALWWQSGGDREDLFSEVVKAIGSDDFNRYSNDLIGYLPIPAEINEKVKLVKSIFKLFQDIQFENSGNTDLLSYLTIESLARQLIRFGPSISGLMKKHVSAYSRDVFLKVFTAYFKQFNCFQKSDLPFIESLLNSLWTRRIDELDLISVYFKAGASKTAFEEMALNRLGSTSLPYEDKMIQEIIELGIDPIFLRSHLEECLTNWDFYKTLLGAKYLLNSNFPISKIESEIIHRIQADLYWGKDLRAVSRVNSYIPYEFTYSLSDFLRESGERGRGIQKFLLDLIQSKNERVPNWMAFEYFDELIAGGGYRDSCLRLIKKELFKNDSLLNSMDRSFLMEFDEPPKELIPFLAKKLSKLKSQNQIILNLNLLSYLHVEQQPKYRSYIENISMKYPESHISLKANKILEKF